MAPRKQKSRPNLISYFGGFSGRAVPNSGATARSRRQNSWDPEAVPVAGGPWVPHCSGWCDADWARDGKLIYFRWRSFTGYQRTYVVPIPHGSDFPKLPLSGFQSEKELRAVATQVVEGAISSGLDSSRYTFSKETSHRNVYRIPLQ